MTTLPCFVKMAFQDFDNFSKVGVSKTWVVGLLTSCYLIWCNKLDIRELLLVKTMPGTVNGRRANSPYKRDNSLFWAGTLFYLFFFREVFRFEYISDTCTHCLFCFHLSAPALGVIAAFFPLDFAPNNLSCCPSIPRTTREPVSTVNLD